MSRTETAGGTSTVRSLRWLLALLAALSILGAACGGSDDEAESDGDTAAETEDTAAEEETSDDTADDAGSDDAMEPEESDDAAAPSGDPIKIGTITSLDGPFTPWGVQVRDGMQLAVDEINAAGGVDGRPIELVVMNDESNADVGITGMERLLDEGVVAVGGVISSDVGLATTSIAEEEQIPLFLVKAGSGAILTADSRFTFRSCLPSAPMVSAPVLELAQDEGYTKIGAIIADYGWGQSIKSALEATFEGSGIELQVEVAPVQESDFTTYLRNLESFGPEFIVATGHPPGAGPITVQSAEIGLDVNVAGAWAPLSLVAGAVGDAGTGRYTDYGCADYDSAEYQDLAKRYLASSDNGFMEDDAVAGYGIVKVVAEAVGAVGDDPVAVAEYLHANSFEVPGHGWTWSWTEWGEMDQAQVITSVIGPGPAPEGVNEAGDWYPETISVSDVLEPYQP